MMTSTQLPTHPHKHTPPPTLPLLAPTLNTLVPPPTVSSSMNPLSTSRMSPLRARRPMSHSSTKTNLNPLSTSRMSPLRQSSPPPSPIHSSRRQQQQQYQHSNNIPPSTSTGSLNRPVTPGRVSFATLHSGNNPPPRTPMTGTDGVSRAPLPRSLNSNRRVSKSPHKLGQPIPQPSLPKSLQFPSQPQQHHQQHSKIANNQFVSSQYDQPSVGTNSYTNKHTHHREQQQQSHLVNSSSDNHGTNPIPTTHEPQQFGSNPVFNTMSKPPSPLMSPGKPKVGSQPHSHLFSSPTTTNNPSASVYNNNDSHVTQQYPVPRTPSSHSTSVNYPHDYPQSQRKYNQSSLQPSPQQSSPQKTPSPKKPLYAERQPVVHRRSEKFEIVFHDSNDSNINERQKKIQERLQKRHDERLRRKAMSKQHEHEIQEREVVEVEAMSSSSPTERPPSRKPMANKKRAPSRSRQQQQQQSQRKSSVREQRGYSRSGVADNAPVEKRGQPSSGNVPIRRRSFNSQQPSLHEGSTVTTSHYRPSLASQISERGSAISTATKVSSSGRVASRSRVKNSSMVQSVGPSNKQVLRHALKVVCLAGKGDVKVVFL
eukprot:TRINITY_DN2977_c0_g1_i2.p1 TRINITY_DN2977_c0_g1~~TRINITY_DN2977_c0_g1_i2.p1  ORF type:complete len:624 (+),score=196.66 TRINITY_DN2977_c0_g1_i2:89-1873(+)